MLRKTKSLLSELDSHLIEREPHNFVESRANNIIQGAIHLLQYIKENFDAEVSDELERLMLNSIKAHDPTKFTRAIHRLRESKSQD